MNLGLSGSCNGLVMFGASLRTCQRCPCSPPQASVMCQNWSGLSGPNALKETSNPPSKPHITSFVCDEL